MDMEMRGGGGGGCKRGSEDKDWTAGDGGGGGEEGGGGGRGTKIVAPTDLQKAHNHNTFKDNFQRN